MTTLRDVAALARVSIRTVSNVVNGYAAVAPATREKVEAAVAELGYRPNLLARSLKQGRSRIAALVVPDLRNPYFAELTSTFVDEGGRRGYTVMVEQTAGDRDLEIAAVQRVTENLQFDGMFISPQLVPANDVYAMRGERPIVLLGEDTHPLLDHVLIDNETAAWEATNHLLGLGRRRIVAVGATPRPTHNTSRVRYAGFRRALVEAGVPDDGGDFVSVTRFTRASGAAAMAEILERDLRPDGIFCFSDVLAVGLLSYADAHGVRIPDDVAVVGFDDVDESSYATVPLTTVGPDRRWIASRAFDLLLERLDGSSDPARREFGPWELRIRQSTTG